jgi:hypothetical protein
LLTANAIAHAETADTSADQTEISIASHAQPRVSKLKPYSVMELEDAHLKELTIHQRQKTQPQLLVTNQWLSLLQTKDGELSILTRPKRLLLKDSMKSSDSMSTDHSTLSQDFQCKELLSALVQAKSPSRDGMERRKRKNVAAQTQTWFFDPVSKTIRSNYWKNYAMHIPGNGAQNELRMTSTINSRWW